MTLAVGPARGLMNELGKLLRKADRRMLERLVGQPRHLVTLLLSGAVLLCTGCGVDAMAMPVGRAPVAVAGPVTAADLRGGLLAADDLPAGFAPITTLADEDGGEVIFQGDPGCRDLTRMLNADDVQDASAEAALALSNGPTGGAAAEQLFAMASPQTAAHVVEEYRRAVGRCPGIRLEAAGAGSETFALQQAPLVDLAQDGSVAAVGATSEGSVEGPSIIQVVAHAGSVVVVTTFAGVTASSAELVASVALHKVRQRFGS